MMQEPKPHEQDRALQSSHKGAGIWWAQLRAAEEHDEQCSRQMQQPMGLYARMTGKKGKKVCSCSSDHWQHLVSLQHD
jgi:hypothetical protein